MNARQPRDFPQPVRYARRGCASLPASYDPICEHRLLSCLLRITSDASRQEKSAVTYVPINSSAPARLAMAAMLQATLSRETIISPVVSEFAAPADVPLDREEIVRPRRPFAQRHDHAVGA